MKINIDFLDDKNTPDGTNREKFEESALAFQELFDKYGGLLPSIGDCVADSDGDIWRVESRQYHRSSITIWVHYR